MATIDDLPYELIWQICHYLPLPELANFKITSQRMNAIGSHKQFYINVWYRLMGTDILDDPCKLLANYRPPGVTVSRSRCIGMSKDFCLGRKFGILTITLEEYNTFTVDNNDIDSDVKRLYYNGLMDLFKAKNKLDKINKSTNEARISKILSEVLTKCDIIAPRKLHQQKSFALISTPLSTDDLKKLDLNMKPIIARALVECSEQGTLFASYTGMIECVAPIPVRYYPSMTALYTTDFKQSMVIIGLLDGFVNVIVTANKQDSLVTGKTILRGDSLPKKYHNITVMKLINEQKAAINGLNYFREARFDWTPISWSFGANSSIYVPRESEYIRDYNDFTKFIMYMCQYGYQMYR